MIDEPSSYLDVRQRLKAAQVRCTIFPRPSALPYAQAASAANSCVGNVAHALFRSKAEICWGDCHAWVERNLKECCSETLFSSWCALCPRDEEA